MQFLSRSTFGPAGGHRTQPASRVIILGPNHRTDPWSDVDDLDKPSRWDRPVLIAIPEPSDANGANQVKGLGEWLAQHVPRRRNTVRFLLRFFEFDPTYWTVLRTTNPIERLNKEFKRRTRAMEVTGGEISTYRCLVYVAQTMEYRWSFHPLSQWTFIYTQNAA